MKLDDVLNDLTQTLGLKKGDTVSWEQIRQWPEGALEIFLNAGWIKPKEPAKSVVCPGCEENCFMPVHVSPTVNAKTIRAFVACDRRDDMGRIPIPLDYLKQWQITERQVAGWISQELGIKSKPKKDKKTKIFLLGDLQGNKKTGSLELVCGERVSLKVSEYSLLLNEIIYFENSGIKIDQKAIFNMVDRSPPANRYDPSIARREVNKLDTQARHKGWQKAYRELKRKNSDRSDNWYALQIVNMHIGKNYSPETIRKNMKK